MLTNVTSLTGNGLKDWLIQRVSAVYFALYAFFLLGYIGQAMPLHYEQWQQLMQNGLFKITSMIALFMLLLHAWIGIWTVTTDYIKCTALRLSVQLVVVLVLFSEMLWGFMIVWRH